MLLSLSNSETKTFVLIQPASHKRTLVDNMVDSVDRFSVPDYIVFAVMLLISAAIGVWYGCGPGGKQTSTKEYLLADQNMRILPVAISLLVSYLSAITLLGVPSEIYTYGAQYYVLILSYFIICGTVGIIFVPMFRRINITCANEVRDVGVLFPIFSFFFLDLVRQTKRMNTRKEINVCSGIAAPALTSKAVETKVITNTLVTQGTVAQSI